MKNDNYPMPRVHCGARTRVGSVCKQPAMKNGKCRLHGGKSKAGREHGRYKHGFYTKEMKAFNRELREDAREIVKEWRAIKNMLS